MTSIGSRTFDPADVARYASAAHGSANSDRRDGSVYVYFNEKIKLAVNVALVTHRPLLLTGPSGSGKSSLAKSVALTLKWRYYEYVVTGRTEARDLLYRYDSIRRLNDANLRTSDLLPREAYLEPGVLWWAINRATAISRGTAHLPEHMWARDPNSGSVDARRAVVLIDEIDKADPDFPNSLLVPIGSYQFDVEHTNESVSLDSSEPPLIIITNNGERELPATFIRRCVALELERPSAEQLVAIAQNIFSPSPGDTKNVPLDPRLFNLISVLANRVTRLAEADPVEGSQRWSTAEYLDAVRACKELGITDGSELETLLEIALVKKTDLDQNEGLS